MEPVRVSVYGPGDNHLASVARNNRGDFVVTDQKGGVTAEGAEATAARHALSELLSRSPKPAHSGRHHPQAAPRPFLRRRLQAEGEARRHVRRVLRRARSRQADDEMGELLYTSMTVDGHTRSFYRFRTPDGIVDYYDEQGNSAKKFLMRNPVKGGRYTSGFGTARAIRCSASPACIPASTGPRPSAPRSSPAPTAPSSASAARAAMATTSASATRTASPPPTATCRATPTASQPGTSVKQGQVIGYVGSTGYLDRPALPLRDPGQQQVRQPDDHPGAARAAAHRPPARRVPEESATASTSLRALDPVTNRVAQATTQQ